MRQRKPGARYGSPEWKARVGAGVRRHFEVRRERARIMPCDLIALARPGSAVRRELRPLLDAGEAELTALVGAIGAERASPQRLLVAQDVARLGVLVRALMLRFGQDGDGETASKIGTLIGVRRAGLLALGLDEQRHEVSLHEYLAQRAAEAAPANGSAQPEPEVASDAIAQPGAAERVSAQDARDADSQEPEGST